MPLATFTSSTDVEELIKTEEIDDFVAGFEYAPPVGLGISWMRGGTGSVPIRFPRWNELSLASVSAHAETVDAVDLDMTTTESSLQPAIIIFRLPIPDEMVASANRGDVPAGMLAEAIVAFLNRMDSDSLATSTGATLQTGSIATAFNLQAFRAAKAYYKAQRIPQSPQGTAMVLSHDAAGALDEAMGSTGASFAITDDDMARFGWSSGYQGRFQGLFMFESDNVAAESTGNSNFITPIGARMSGLGAVINEMPNIRPTRGDDGESRATSFFNIRAYYATGLVNPRRFVEVLSA